MINRELYKQLLQWKKSKNRKPLVLTGARQVGKTFLLKLFGKQEYNSVIYLNFEEDRNLKNFFIDNLNPSNIIENISIYINQTIDQQHFNNTLIILDEIQETPEAIKSLKYFYENMPNLHIAAAGSLLGVKLDNFSGFPVGKVNFLNLYPLNFLEFLAAIGQTKQHSMLTKLLKSNSPTQQIADPIHQQLIVELKKYFFIGGMPEVVARYIETQNLLTIQVIQQEILKAYMLDFGKHANKEQIMKITQIWESIPNQLAKENKKFNFSYINQNARSREYKDALSWLMDAGLIYKSYNLSTPKLPLPHYSEHNFFKIFLFDVGLLSAMSNIPARTVIEMDVKRENIISEFYGAFTENFVAQELFMQRQQLNYWTSKGIAEVDFIVEHDLNIYPLEVKAGVSHHKKSLLEYEKKYQPKLLLRASLMNLKKDHNIINIPLYLVGNLFELISNLY